MGMLYLPSRCLVLTLFFMQTEFLIFPWNLFINFLSFSLGIYLLNSLNMYEKPDDEVRAREFDEDN